MSDIFINSHLLNKAAFVINITVLSTYATSHGRQSCGVGGVVTPRFWVGSQGVEGSCEILFFMKTRSKMVTFPEK